MACVGPQRHKKKNEEEEPPGYRTKNVRKEGREENEKLKQEAAGTWEQIQKPLRGK